MSEILMPQLSESMAEGRLLKWHVRLGSKVRPGDVIAEVETEKANMDIEAPEAGTVIELRVAAGEVAGVGAVLAVYAPHGEPLTRSLATESPRPSVASAAMPNPGPVAPINASPLAARLADRRGIDLAKVKGTGPGGRILKEDVLAWRDVQGPRNGAVLPAEAMSDDSASEPEPAFATPPPADSIDSAVTVSVHGSDAATNESDRVAEPGSAVADTLEELDTCDDEDEPLVANIPEVPRSNPGPATGGYDPARPAPSGGFVHEPPAFASPVRGFFRGSVSINVSALVDAHAGILARFKVAGSGFASPYTPVFLKAAVIALLDQPSMTSAFAAPVGISISVPRPGGLKHYVMENCGNKSLKDMFREYAALTSESAHGLAEVSETTDVVLSVSDLSAFGVDEFSSVAHPFCHAFLSLGAIVERPVAGGHGIEAAHILTATLVINQEKVNMLAAAKFLRDFRELLEHPILLAGN